MSTYSISSFFVILFFSMVFGDLIERPQNAITDSRLSEVQLVFTNGQGCDCESFRITVETQEQRCTFDVTGRSQSFRLFRLAEIDRCENIIINNQEKTPNIIIQALSGTFCIQRIKAISDSREEFTRNFLHPETPTWHVDTGFSIGLLHNSQIEHVNTQLQQTECPAPNTGCPNEHIGILAVNTAYSTWYCDFNPKCSEVSDSEPTVRNSGRVCFETYGAQYDFNDLCCGIGPRGNLPACPTNSHHQSTSAQREQTNSNTNNGNQGTYQYYESHDSQQGQTGVHSYPTYSDTNNGNPGTDQSYDYYHYYN